MVQLFAGRASQKHNLRTGEAANDGGNVFDYEKRTFENDAKKLIQDMVGNLEQRFVKDTQYDGVNKSNKSIELISRSFNAVLLEEDPRKIMYGQDGIHEYFALTNDEEEETEAVLCDYETWKYEPKNISAGVDEQLLTIAKQKRPIASIAKFLLSLSGSTAEVERGFSRIKLTKTSARNRLNDKTLDNILCIRAYP